MLGAEHTAAARQPPLHLSTNSQVRHSPLPSRTCPMVVAHRVAIGKNHEYRDVVLHEGVDHLPEVVANERLASRDRDAADAALCHLVNEVEQLLGGGMSKLGMRRTHQAMLAPIVAPTGDGPMDVSLIAAGIAIPALLRKENGAVTARSNDAIGLHVGQPGALLPWEGVQVYLLHAVAAHEESVLLPTIEICLARGHIIQAKGQKVPAAQTVTWVEQVSHGTAPVKKRLASSAAGNDTAGKTDSPDKRSISNDTITLLPLLIYRDGVYSLLS